MDLRGMRPAAPSVPLHRRTQTGAPQPRLRTAHQAVPLASGQKPAAALGLVRAVQAYRTPQQHRVQARSGWRNGRTNTEEDQYYEDQDDPQDVYISPYRSVIEEELEGEPAAREHISLML